MITVTTKSLTVQLVRQSWSSATWICGNFLWQFYGQDYHIQTAIFGKSLHTVIEHGLSEPPAFIRDWHLVDTRRGHVTYQVHHMLMFILLLSSIKIKSGVNLPHLVVCSMF